MSRPERVIQGPERATARDIDSINRVFADAFTDRYHRDGMTGVRVPHLNPAVWRFALADAAEGALLWRDEAGGLVAFNIVHRSGAEGWMGPLAVRPDHQGHGIGTTVVEAGIASLDRQGARTVGLETMPRTVENIGFYSRLGFRPGHLTVSLCREVDAADLDRGERLPRNGARLRTGLERCRALLEALAPGVDFTRELALTQEMGLGGISVVSGEAGLDAFAVWHSAPLAEGRSADELRVLKLVAGDLGAFRRIVASVEAEAVRERARRVTIRCQTAFREAYGALVDGGYRVHWTDLRMTLGGREESPVPAGGVVLSNWEI